MLIMAISAVEYLGVHLDLKVLKIGGNITSLFFQVGCLFAWAWTLIRLYKEIEHSEKLLPNKHIFILHGSLLILYLLIFTLIQVVYYFYVSSEDRDT